MGTYSLLLKGPEGPQVVLGMRPVLVLSKASALPSMLYLQPYANAFNHLLLLRTYGHTVSF